MRQDKFEVLGVVAWFGSVGLCLSASPRTYPYPAHQWRARQQSHRLRSVKMGFLSPDYEA